MIKVIPGIGTLVKDFSEIKRRIARVAPFVDWVQVDIADGKLVENVTFSDPEPFKAIATPPKRELHMMVEDATEQVDVWIEAGFDRIIAQIEGIGDPEAFIDAVQLHSVEVGLSLDIGTPITLVEPYLDQLDVVQLMSIEMGLSGQSFIPQVIPKITQLREIDDMVSIEIDGGVDLETGKKCVEAGATRLVSTSYIYGAEDVREAVRKLSELS